MNTARYENRIRAFWAKFQGKSKASRTGQRFPCASVQKFEFIWTVSPLFQTKTYLNAMELRIIWDHSVRNFKGNKTLLGHNANFFMCLSQKSKITHIIGFILVYIWFLVRTEFATVQKFPNFENWELNQAVQFGKILNQNQNRWFGSGSKPGSCWFRTEHWHH